MRGEKWDPVFRSIFRPNGVSSVPHGGGSEGTSTEMLTRGDKFLTAWPLWLFVSEPVSESQSADPRVDNTLQLGSVATDQVIVIRSLKDEQLFFDSVFRCCGSCIVQSLSQWQRYN